MGTVVSAGVVIRYAEDQKEVKTASWSVWFE
jgi:hypothetical protein